MNQRWEISERQKVVTTERALLDGSIEVTTETTTYETKIVRPTKSQYIGERG